MEYIKKIMGIQASLCEFIILPIGSVNHSSKAQVLQVQKKLHGNVKIKRKIKKRKSLRG